MGIDIIEMTIADYDDVLVLWQQAEGLGLHPDECDSRKGVARYLARNPGTCFVARDGERLIGAVLCGTDGRKGYIHHLAVAAAYRRRRIATEFVRRCTAALKEIGIAKCNLFVFATNDGAVEFWRKLGCLAYDEVGVKAMMLEIE